MTAPEREVFAALAGTVAAGGGLIYLDAHELLVLAGVLMPWAILLGWWIAGWVCDKVDPPDPHDTLQDSDWWGT